VKDCDVDERLWPAKRFSVELAFQHQHVRLTTHQFDATFARHPHVMVYTTLPGIEGIGRIFQRYGDD